MLMIKKNGQLISVGATNLVGGPQPTLFAPVVTGGTNEIAWANNANNGGFDVTITADVDGTPVTSPLTITEEMDGSTLTIRASAQYFTDAVITITLSYLAPGGTSFVSPSNYTADASKPYTYLKIGAAPLWTYTYNGTTYTLPSTGYAFYLPIELNQNVSIEFSLMHSELQQMSIPAFTFGKTSHPLQDVLTNVREADLGFNRIDFSSAALSILDASDNVAASGNVSNRNYINIEKNVNAGSYHFIINVSF